jgi:SNF2 family DNA or RNA helicase
LFLQAVRLDALHGTAPFVSVQRVGIIPGEYQLVPLVMALRQQPVRLLIADTIGLGKTIEAGLIVKELLARNQARSVLVLTPANLREQWRQQMRDLFYLDFEIVSSETRKRLERSIPPGADPWLYFDRLIVSMDYAKTARIKHEILKRKWDVVIVDEAHNASMPHMQMGRKADMERWELIDQVAAKASKHMLLLTATPHNGYTDSYSSLLRMLSPELVYGSDSDLKPNRERAISHVCQRTRNDVQQWFDEAGKPFPFPQREPGNQTEVPVSLANEYTKLLEQMDEVMDLVEAHARVMGRQQPVEWLRLHLHRRALSSPEALRRSLENRIDKLKQGTVEEGAAESEEVEENLILASLGDRGAEDSDTEDEADRRVDSVALRIDQQLQLTHFGNILSKLRSIKAGSDRKLAKLRDEMISSLIRKAAENTPARIIVFTR